MIPFIMNDIEKDDIMVNSHETVLNILIDSKKIQLWNRYILDLRSNTVMVQNCSGENEIIMKSFVTLIRFQIDFLHQMAKQTQITVQIQKMTNQVKKIISYQISRLSLQ